MKDIAVYHSMNKRDTFDLTLISVIDMLLKVLIERNEKNHFRLSRMQTMSHLLHKVEPSYIGYLPDQFINCSNKFIKFLHTDINSLVSNIKEAK
jgi:hypothetical protein